MTPKFELGRYFCTMHCPQVSSSYVSFNSYRVDKQTNKHTNKQTPLKTSNVLHNATTLGKKSRNVSAFNTAIRSDSTSRMWHCGARLIAEESCLAHEDLRSITQLHMRRNVSQWVEPLEHAYYFCRPTFWHTCCVLSFLC